MQLKELLQNPQLKISSVVPFDLSDPRLVVFDFSTQNPIWLQLGLENTAAQSTYIAEILKKAVAPLGFGKYNEDRDIYRKSSLFQQTDEIRSVHLGIDIMTQAGVAVISPLDAIIHSFQDNSQYGDYGPTIILEHELAGLSFWTLYGHLSRKSLHGLKTGQKLPQGIPFATIGESHENGKWSPHLHFQLIREIGDFWGDFPGVAALSQRAYYLDLCPDPNLLLRAPVLW